MLTIKHSEFEQVEPFITQVFKEQAEAYFDELSDKLEERLTLAAYEGDELAGALVARRASARKKNYQYYIKDAQLPSSWFL